MSPPIDQERSLSFICKFNCIYIDWIEIKLGINYANKGPIMVTVVGELKVAGDHYIFSMERKKMSLFTVFCLDETIKTTNIYFYGQIFSDNWLENLLIQLCGLL